MKGSCLCGAVRYEIHGAARSVVACHCSQCRKTSGHYVAATQVASADLDVTGAAALRWFRSSPTAERGFCGTCGSQLFWRPDGRAVISIMAGTLDGPSGLRLDRQIHVESKGDYYDAPAVPEVDPGAL